MTQLKLMSKLLPGGTGMNDRHLFVLSEIYFKTATGDFITMGDLETLSGSSGSELRPVLEDLKEERLIVEHQEGFQVSRHGLIFCKTRWD